MIDTHLLKELFISIDDNNRPYILNTPPGIEAKAKASMVIQVVYCSRSGKIMTEVLKNKMGAKG
jgi:hypothetical protein